MILGPFSSFNIEEIKKVLTENSVQFEIIQDPKTLETMQSVDKQRQPQSHPTYQSRGDFLYISILPEELQKVAPYFERFGFVAAPSAEVAQHLESSEYHCPSCDYTSDHTGECPTHKQTLLEFSEWLEAKSHRSEASKKTQFYFFIFVIGVIALIMISRMIGLF